MTTVLYTCPDWRQLAAARDTSPDEPAGWEDALRHLDDCAACRRAAVEADPLLAFRRLPAPTFAADEVEAMRLRVAALRGAARVAPPSAAPAAGFRAAAGGRLVRSLRPLRALPLRQLAAAVLVLAAVLAGGNGARHQSAASKAVALVPAGAPLDAALASEPVLDELDQPFDHVVQWNGDDLSVVLVVDERLGV